MAYLSLSSLIPSLVLASAVLSSNARAAGEPCYRDTECPGGELCLDGTCTQPESSPPACTDDSECEDVCDDGFCKFEGIVCRSAAGECWVEGGAGQCLCADGDGSGWSGGFNPDDPPQMQTDAEVQEGCFIALADSCGTEAPSLPASCQGEVLTDCEAYVAHVNGLAELCGEPPPEVNTAQVASCCETQDDPMQADYRACVLAIADATSCPGDALDVCEGGGGEPEDDSDAAETSEGESGAADDDDTKAGCSVAGGGLPAPLALLLGFALVGRTRRS